MDRQNVSKRNGLLLYAERLSRCFAVACAATFQMAGPRAYVIHRHARSVEAAFDRPERQLASSAGCAKD